MPPELARRISRVRVLKPRATPYFNITIWHTDPPRGAKFLWPRAPLCLGPQELIWLLVRLLLLLMLLLLVQVQGIWADGWKDILADGSKAQKYLGHRRHMPRTLWNDLHALVSHALNLIHIPKQHESLPCNTTVTMFSPAQQDPKLQIWKAIEIKISDSLL